MNRLATLAAALTLAAGTPALAKGVKVDGADVTYPARVDRDGTALRLTGTGVRKKFIFNVYAVASYVGADAKVASASELPAVSVPKRLHLVMERDVDGDTMADAFRDAIAMNHDVVKLKAAVAQLTAYLKEAKAKDDDHIVFDYVPGTGVTVSRTGKKPITIAGDAFARAFWDVYFGPKNISDDLKKKLAAQL